MRRARGVLSGALATAVVSAVAVFIAPAAEAKLPPPLPALQVALRTNDLVYDATRHQLLATVPSTAAAYGNSIVTLDPNTLAVTGSTFVGSEPGRLALSADGSTLYVGIDGSGSVAQLDWTNRTVVHTISLGAGYGGRPLRARDLAVVPSDPTQVVVSRQDVSITPSFAGLVSYRDGVALPSTTPAQIGSSAIEFGSIPGRLYGFNQESTGFEFFRNDVDQTGVHQLSANPGLLSGFDTDLIFAGGRLYGSSGQVIDPEARVPVGTFATSSRAFTVDAVLGTASFLRDETNVAGGSPLTLRTFDTSTFLPTATYSVLGASGTPRTLVQAGPGRLAARTGDTGSLQTTSLVLINTLALAGATGEFTPLAPTRVLDTRDGTGRPAPGALAPDQSIDVQLGGRGGVPAQGVAAVVLNATVTAPTGSGYVTIWPSGDTRPVISSLNFTPGLTVPNLVTVAVGQGGRVSAHNSTGSTHLIFDVVGYYGTRTGTPGARFVPLTPSRILDTRDGLGIGHRLGAGESARLQVAGAGGVPATNVVAVALNVTAVGATAPTFLTVFPGGASRPYASNLNVVPGVAIPNLVISGVGADGSLTIYNDAGSVDVVADVAGYYTTARNGDEGRFLPFAPFRSYDSRDPGERRLFPNERVVFGSQSTTLGALVINLTAVLPTAAGYLTAYPYPGSPPYASNVNFTPGQIVPNAAIVRLDPQFAVYNSAGSTDIVVNVFGAFT